MRFFLSKPYLIAVAIVVITSCSAIAARHAFASEAPPIEVERHADAIRENQPEIAKEKKIIAEHQKRLDALKTDNAMRVGGMQAFGWTLDWTTLRPVKMTEDASFQ